MSTPNLYIIPETLHAVQNLSPSSAHAAYLDDILQLDLLPLFSLEDTKENHFHNFWRESVNGGEFCWWSNGITLRMTRLILEHIGIQIVV
jgi:hypothetical protein